MCGRFVQSQPPQAYADFLGATVVATEALVASWNVAPTDQVYAAAEHEDQRRLGSFRWGLIPWFAKDRRIGARQINARAETAHQKASYKEALAKRRCLIPADGFYEWQRRDDGSKLAHYLYAASGDPLALAGLWASWRDPDSGDRVVSCSIITTDAVPGIREIHGRMPVALPADRWDAWLDRSLTDLREARDLLSDPVADIGFHTVSSLVNSVRNNVPDCVAPLAEEIPGSPA